MKVTMNVTEWLDTLSEETQEKVLALEPKQIKLLLGLSPSQTEAAMAIDGPTQINAVAGAGKTRVLVQRLALMLAKGIKPHNIMVTTFTKKASEEMVERLTPLVSKMVLQQLTIGTTHSIGYRILSKEYAENNNPMGNAFKKKNGVLFNGFQKVFGDNIKKALIADRSIPFEIKQQIRDIPVPKFLKAVGSAKNSGMDYFDFEAETDPEDNRALAYSHFYTKYEQTKKEEQLLDGDDLIFLLWKLFKDDPEVLAKYQRYYSYIMVDEAQDNNGIQYELFDMLSRPKHNLFVVGDDDQSMYGFRGARPDQFINFSTNYKGTSVISLEDNYRSHPHILEVANSVIKNNSVRLIKSLKAKKEGEGKVVTYKRYPDEATEAEDVVSQIAIDIGKDEVAPKDIAILYRTNAQSRAVEEQLIIQGLPYVIHGGVSFYERKEVKDLVAYLQLAVNPHDDDAFKRVVNIPSRYLGKAFLEKVSSYNGSCWDAIQGGVSLKNYEVSGTQEFIKTVNGIQEFMQNNTISEVIEFIIDDFYRKHLEDSGDDEEDTARLENLDTLKFAVSRYEKVEDFLTYIKEMNETAKMDINGVQLMTIHKSKGLEFSYVNIIGLSQGTLPHFRALEASANGNSGAIEEERRLLYVAITRAILSCRISSPASVNGKPVPVSVFTRELGLEIKLEEPEETMVHDKTDVLVEKFMQERVINQLEKEQRSLYKAE